MEQLILKIVSQREGIDLTRIHMKCIEEMFPKQFETSYFIQIVKDLVDSHRLIQLMFIPPNSMTSGSFFFSQGTKFNFLGRVTDDSSGDPEIIVDRKS